MGKVWIVAQHEYIINVRRAGFIIMTALIPALGIIGLLAATFLGGQVPEFLESQFSTIRDQVGVVDQMGAFSPILADYQDHYKLFANQEAGREAVRKGGIVALLVIPVDYMSTGKVQVVSKESGLTAAKMEDSASSRQFFVEHLLRDKLDPAMRQRLADPITPVLVSLSSNGESEGDGLSTVVGILVPYFLAIMLIITIFVTSGYLLRGVSEEKTNRVIELLLSSVSAQELLAGKVFGLGALGLTQVTVWVVSVMLLGGIASSMRNLSIPLLDRPEVFGLAIIYYVLGFMMYAVLMGSVGALGTSMQESQQMAGLFSMMAALPMFFAGFVFANPNMILMRVLSWFPLTAPTTMMLRLPMAEVPMIDIFGSFTMIILTIPVILWAGSKVFRMGLLMYGKRPTVKQVWQTIREA